jgi:signal transduction histidine kinase
MTEQRTITADMLTKDRKEFAVDAALLSELGERLVMRPAIALGELVKNSFDADASTCRIEFPQDKDEIIVSDDGTGMSEEDFLQYWMRLGTTHKVDQAVSKIFGRPLTGSKGIGRLSTQFLAYEMTLQSTPANGTKEFLEGVSAGGPKKSPYAIVDWRSAVAGADLSTVQVAWDMLPDVFTYPNGSPSGTRITLKYLKGQWDSEAIRNLGDDVWMLRSPFRRPSRRERGEEGDGRAVGTRRAEDFYIELEAPGITGAQEAFDKRFRMVLSNWKARIRGRLDGGRSGGAGLVAVDFRTGYPADSEEAKQFTETVRLPIERPAATPSMEPEEEQPKESLVDKATFEILIFKAEGRQPGGVSVGDLREYLAKFGNVSVYDAGFRLPYYGSGRDAAGQDWLSIAADQGRRLGVSYLLPEHLRMESGYMEALPAPGRIFGAVEINTNHEREVGDRPGIRPDGWLQIQAGRDRLKDNAAFYQLRDLVRFSLDFYANRYRLLNLEIAEKNQAKEPASRKYDRAIGVLESRKNEIPMAVFREVKKEFTEARKASVAEERVMDSRAALLAPLASAGMAVLALNHEISRESGFLNLVSSRLRRIAKKYSIQELRDIAGEFDEARGRLDSLRELFAPLLSDMDKSATYRLKVRAVVEQSVGAMRALMPGVKFDAVSIPASLRFPIGSLAEWNALLQNVLSNAWNALLDSDRAEVSFRGGKDRRGREWLHVSDSGQGLTVPLSEADRLFEPFERRIKISHDKRSIAIGGQGLGLAIVRMIARRRSVKVAFVPPEEGFSTTFEIAWRGAKE